MKREVTKLERQPAMKVPNPPVAGDCYATRSHLHYAYQSPWLDNHCRAGLDLDGGDLHQRIIC